MSDNDEYEMARKLAIEIETNIHTLYFKSNNNGDKYREKGRMILVTLNDVKNTHLRTKILTGNITPRELAISNE